MRSSIVIKVTHSVHEMIFFPFSNIKYQLTIQPIFRASIFSAKCLNNRWKVLVRNCVRNVGCTFSVKTQCHFFNYILCKKKNLTEELLVNIKLRFTKLI